MQIVQWFDVNDQLPESQKRVLICVDYTRQKWDEENKKTIEVIVQRITIGEYVAPRTALAEEWFEEPENNLVDYDENNDIEYVCEDWYESPIEPELFYAIEGKVTHWMYLPEKPSEEEIKKEKDMFEKLEKLENILQKRFNVNIDEYLNIDNKRTQQTQDRINEALKRKANN